MLIDLTSSFDFILLAGTPVAMMQMANPT
ncbi:unnamed protein product, partial [Rotaria magnacalcarata]